MSQDTSQHLQKSSSLESDTSCFCSDWHDCKNCLSLTCLSVGSANDTSFLHPLFFSSVSFLISSIPIQLLSAPPHLCSTHFLSFSFPSLIVLLPSHDSSPSVCSAPAFSQFAFQWHSINQSITQSIKQSICLFINQSNLSWWSVFNGMGSSPFYRGKFSFNLF